MQTRPPIAGRYRLHELLGTGGMGEVWSATDSMLERQVAVKLLKDVHDPAMAERFRREALSTAAVRHDDVVSIYDTGVERQPGGGDLVYLVMELLPGPTLADALRQHGRMPVDLAVRLVGQVADALAAAHRAGVVHRDIKPANLMFDAEHRLTVLDFGIAAVAAADQAGLTATGTVIGSPAYLSPEQAAGQQVGPATDVYSLGCVFFEMLCGEAPYPGGHPLSVLHQHVAAPVPRLRDRMGEGAQLPAYVDQLVTSMLAKKPSARPSLEQVVERLRTGAVPGMEEATEVMRTRPPDRPLSTPLALPTNPTQPVPQRPVAPRPSPPRRQRPFPVGRLLGAVVVVVLCIFAISALATMDTGGSGSSSDSPSDHSSSNGFSLPKWDDDEPDPQNNLDRLDEWRRRAERFHVISPEKSQEWKEKIDRVRELQQRGEDTEDKIEELRDQMKDFTD